MTDYQKKIAAMESAMDPQAAQQSQQAAADEQKHIEYIQNFDLAAYGAHLDTQPAIVAEEGQKLYKWVYEEKQRLLLAGKIKSQNK